MKPGRRQVLAAAAGALASSVFGAVAQPKSATVGVLTSLSAERYATNLGVLRGGLRELGYVEGKNLRLELRYADGRLDRLSELAAQLEKLPADVIVTVGSHVTRVTRRATRSVPIVMAYAGDPVGGGFADSLSRPGGRITGLTTLSPQLGGKRLELLREIVPRLREVGVLWNPEVPERVIQFKDTQSAARAMRVALHSFEARRADEIEPVMARAAAARPDALIVLGDALLDANLPQIARLAAKHRLLFVHQSRGAAQRGALFSYGPDHAHLHARAAVYVDRILKGAKPAELPIEQPTQFELVVNLKTSKAFGIAIPRAILARADEIIQ